MNSTTQTLEIVGVRAAFWALTTASPRTSVIITADRIADTEYALELARYLSTDHMDDGAVDFWTSVGGGVMVRETATGQIIARYVGGRVAQPDWPPFDDLMTWTNAPDSGGAWSDNGRFDVLESPDGYMLRENQGDTESPHWEEIGTYATLTAAQDAATARGTS